MSTGYFGVPGQIARGKTHFVLHGKPICGVRLGRRNQFLFCAAGFHEAYVDCQRCKREIRELPRKRKG